MTSRLATEVWNALLAARRELARAKRARAAAGTGAAPTPAEGRLAIGWLAPTTDMAAASVRYRCLHPARVLAGRGHANHFFTRVEALLKALPSLDVVVIVKRLDAGLVELAVAARTRRIPLFLDLCDDLLSPRYGKNADARPGIVFAALAPALSGVLVPSPAMAERVAGRARALGLAGPRVHVVPDAAETREAYDRTAAFVGAGRLPPPAPPEGAAGEARRRVVWFGNFGARNTNFGILSLLPAMPVLAELNGTLPLELVVVSNHRVLFEALTKGSGVPARYVPWSAAAVYDELAAADVALLSSGDDELSTVKSSNRALQALAAGVPVVTLSGAALGEFEGIVLAGRGALRENLAHCLRTDRTVVRRRFVEPATPILARYAPERLGAVLETILLTAATRAPASDRDGTLLFVMETPEDLGALAEPLREAVAAQLRCEVLVTPDAVLGNGGIRDLLVETGLLPRVCDRVEDIRSGALAGVGTVVLADTVGGTGRPVAGRLARIASASGCRVLAAADLPAGGLPVPVPPRPAAPSDQTPPDVVFVVPPGEAEADVTALCRSVAARLPGAFEIASATANIPNGRRHVFCGAGLLAASLARCPAAVESAQTVVWCADAPPEDAAAVARDVQALRQAGRVVFTSETLLALWIACGLKPAHAAVVPGAADPAIFRGHARKDGAVGLLARFGERERPDLLRAVVHLLPGRRFVLAGPGWRSYALLEEMIAASNFMWMPAPPGGHAPGERAEILSGIDVVLSPAATGFGAVPLLEAMMENAVPVACRTGVAPDLIRHGQNGFLFDDAAPAEVVAELVERAFVLDGDVRGTVLDHDWNALAAALVCG